MRSFLFIIAVVVVIAAFFIWLQIYLPQDPGSDDLILLSIKRGEDAKDISISLQNNGLIRSRSLFRFYIIAKGVSGNLQAGDYNFARSMNIPEIVDMIVSGKTVKNTITIIEGWNLRDIGLYFKDKGMFSDEELFQIIGFPLVDYTKTDDMPYPKDFSDRFDFLGDKPKNISLEGYIFPDTYYFSSQDDIEDIINKFLENFDRKLTEELRAEIRSQQKTIFEIITMASLLEKEVITLKDKKIVSGILWKRMESGIPLQVDATIAYITGKKTAKITNEETEIDSPYNTYKYLGLPLGPISNPGMESIEAAIHPSDSQYWYYLSTPEGKTIFSRTLEEHNIAKSKYLR